MQPLSDHALARRIAETLAADERFRRQPLAVEVQNGVAILTYALGQGSGSVRSPMAGPRLIPIVISWLRNSRSATA